MPVTHSSTIVTSTDDGEVTLARTITEEFSGTALPSGWGTRATPWNAGGTVSVSGGSLNVDGHRANTSASFGPGGTLEFRATFGAGTFQNAGLGQDLEAGGETWIVFGTNEHHEYPLRPREHRRGQR